jgi:hypothetical protein
VKKFLKKDLLSDWKLFLEFSHELQIRMTDSFNLLNQEVFISKKKREEIERLKRKAYFFLGLSDRWRVKLLEKEKATRNKLGAARRIRASVNGFLNKLSFEEEKVRTHLNEL